ncbi:hexosyltransferase, glycosyltransferase [Haloferax elongans ATCC BAA-1513]|uniref:Hexosyltransferase, glycosyltransferase n=1 Tax=Haloferax elongans ATCC BAA-1513 TaxID=1230453 RepID=M0I0E8_HALEO|nr:glycosyltransferase [Haloferax elongans]ELZ89473.1 hexosyltransferase, glycosyltransferase [Haloferax elongans ATCC BAA-1513]
MDTDRLADKNLLVVSHGYKHFVKSQVDVLASYFDTITVCVRYNWFADVASRLPIDAGDGFGKDAKIARDNVPDNVHVVETPLLYLPVDIQREHLLGQQHVRKVRKKLEDYPISFDLIHCHMSWTSGYVGARLKDELDIPYLLTVHANRDWFERQLQSDNDRLETAWSAADRLIRVNRRDRSKLDPYNDDVVHVPNGYDTDIFERIPTDEARKRLGLDDDTPVVFALGTLKPRKGFQHLMRAMTRVHDSDPGTRLVIGGQGGMRDELESLASDLGIADQTALLGYVESETLNDWMNAADVFVLPSYSESFGVVQLEAMACGTPVVATKNGGSEEVVTSEAYGLLVDGPESHDELADAVVEALHRQWDADAIESYANEFTWENVCEELADLYVDVLDESQKSTVSTVH